MCIFCKIAHHEIPSSIVYEDEHYLAFLDVNPVTKGHTLIIPKAHFDDFTQTPGSVIKDIAEIARKLTKQYDAVLRPNGYNLLTNAHEAAGQSVNHVHFHLIPRYDQTDGLVLAFKGKDKDKLDEEHKLDLRVK